MRKLFGFLAVVLVLAVASFAAAPSATNGYAGYDYSMFKCTTGDTMKALDTVVILNKQPAPQGKMYLSTYPLLGASKDTAKIGIWIMAFDPYDVAIGPAFTITDSVDVGGGCVALPLFGGAKYTVWAVSSGTGTVQYLPPVYALKNCDIQSGRGGGNTAFKVSAKVGAQ